MKTLPGGKGESAKRNLILAMELGLFGAFLAVISPCARAFSLLGPYAPWMDEAKSFSQGFQFIQRMPFVAERPVRIQVTDELALTGPEGRGFALGEV